MVWLHSLLFFSLLEQFAPKWNFPHVLLPPWPLYMLLPLTAVVFSSDVSFLCSLYRSFSKWYFIRKPSMLLYSFSLHQSLHVFSPLHFYPLAANHLIFLRFTFCLFVSKLSLSTRTKLLSGRCLKNKLLILYLQGLELCLVQSRSW